MSRATYFVQNCPVCGRSLQVRVELLGKTVSCRHCGGAFVARDPAMGPPGPPTPSEDIVNRANELLSSVDSFRPRPR
jgi:hypothetical protein